MPSQEAFRRYIDPELKTVYAENTGQNTWNYQYTKASGSWAKVQPKNQDQRPWSSMRVLVQ